MSGIDRTFTISERALELMRSYCDTASPQSYELWFTYVTSLKPTLNEVVKQRLRAGTKISDDEIRRLHRAHLSDEKLAAQTDLTGVSLLTQIDEISSLIDVAAGSAARYDASLNRIAGDLDDQTGEQSLRGILDSLLAATHEVASTNRSLEIRLKDSRKEVESLRETLVHVRSETLVDALTGIANRKHFEEALVTSVTDAHAAGEPLALVVIDIDHFKRFNDVYGHLTGDQVLKLVATSMQASIGSQAMLARFGGEEFAMILPRTELTVAFGCAERVRKSVESRELLKRSTNESLGRITVSLGVACLTRGETATGLLERADACMYAAKRTGRNRTVAESDAVSFEVSNAA